MAEVEYNGKRAWMAMAALPLFVVVGVSCADRTATGGEADTGSLLKELADEMRRSEGFVEEIELAQEPGTGEGFFEGTAVVDGGRLAQVILTYDLEGTPITQTYRFRQLPDGFSISAPPASESIEGGEISQPPLTFPLGEAAGS